MANQTIIVGGGLMGVATLYELVSRGEPAMLVEAEGAVAQGASYANGGMLTASMSDPWNNPGVGRHLLGSLFDPYAAMKLRPAALPGLLLWGVQFLRNSLPARHRRATELCFRLAHRSASLLRERIAELDLDVELSDAGTMKIFESVSMLNEARKMAEGLAPLGLRFETLDADGLAAKEPELEGTAGQFAGGLYFPDDGTGDARRFVEELAQAAKARGAVIELATPVRRVVVENGSVAGVETDQGFLPAQQVVLACGFQTPALARPLGVRLLIKPAKGYSVTVDARGWNARPRLTVIDDAMHAAVSVIGDRLRFVGTAEFAGANTKIDPARIDNLVNLFRRLYPHLADNLDPSNMEPWAGLRPMSADGLPFIGPAGPQGLWINAGQGHLGWTMAAGSAELLADQMTGVPPKIEAAPFHPSR